MTPLVKMSALWARQAFAKGKTLVRHEFTGMSCIWWAGDKAEI